MLLEGKPGTTGPLCGASDQIDPDKLTLTRSIAATPALGEQQYEGATILYLKPGALTAPALTRLQPGSRRRKDASAARPARLRCGDPRRSAAGQLFVKQGTLATLEGQKFPARASPPTRHIYHCRAAGRARQPRHLCAAELTAAAIEGLKRAIGGERTFGRHGSKTIELPDGAALLLTVAKYEGPDGKKIPTRPYCQRRVGQRSKKKKRKLRSQGDQPLLKALELLKARTPAFLPSVCI